MKLLIKNAAYLITMNKQREIISDAALLVEDGIITAIGRTEQLGRSSFQPDETIDADQGIVMPGLINAHIHTNQQLARGLGDGVYYPTYTKERVGKYEEILCPEEAYVASLCAGLEAVKSGTTCLIDTAAVHYKQAERAISDLGIRAVLHKSADKPLLEEKNDPEAIAEIADTVRSYGRRKGSLIRPGIAVQTITAHNEYLLQLNDLRKQLGLSLSVDMAVYYTTLNRHKELYMGQLPMERWAELGALSSSTILNHLNCPTMEDQELLLSSGAKVVHCLTAGFGLGLGALYGPHLKLMKKGVVVAVGTASSAAGGSGDLFKAAFSLGAHRDFQEDATLLPPEKILEMLIINGARCAGWDDEIGSLEQGKAADLIIIKPDGPEWIPIHNPLSNLFFSGSSRNVKAVIVGGRIIMADRVLKTINEKEVLEEAQARGIALLERSGLDQAAATSWPIY